MYVCQNINWGTQKSLWPIFSPHDAADYSSSTFHAGHHACLKARLCTVLRQPESPSEPPYPASTCQSHLNDPDNKTKAINLWYWLGGRVGDNTDAICERQQRRRFSARGWLETRRLLWHADLRRLNRSGCHRWQMMTLSADRGDGI